VATYGCESWTLKISHEDTLEASEMKALRQFLRISWTAKRTDSWVLEQAGVNGSLLANVKSGKLRYFSHIMRGKDKSLEKGIIKGTLPGNRKSGRPRRARIDNVTSWTGLKLEEAI